MDPGEKPAAPSSGPDCTTGLETGAPKRKKLGRKRGRRHWIRCSNGHVTVQIQHQEHSFLSQVHVCYKCALLSKACDISPAEGALKLKPAPYRKRYPTQGQIESGTTSGKAENPTKKLASHAGVPSVPPRRSADQSGLGISVSVLDSSTLEEATSNFSFEGVAQTPCRARQAPKTCDQASVSASSEWQEILEAAKILMMLRGIFPDPL